MYFCIILPKRDAVMIKNYMLSISMCDNSEDSVKILMHQGNFILKQIKINRLIIQSKIPWGGLNFVCMGQNICAIWYNV